MSVIKNEKIYIFYFTCILFGKEWHTKCKPWICDSLRQNRPILNSCHILTPCLIFISYFSRTCISHSFPSSLKSTHKHVFFSTQAFFLFNDTLRTQKQYQTLYICKESVALPGKTFSDRLYSFSRLLRRFYIACLTLYRQLYNPHFSWVEVSSK